MISFFRIAVDSFALFLLFFEVFHAGFYFLQDVFPMGFNSNAACVADLAKCINKEKRVRGVRGSVL